MAEQNINSDAFTGQESIQNINSDAVTLVTQTQFITSMCYITPVFVFDAQTNLIVLSEEELLVETNASNPIPLAPTNLVATDTGVGDSVNLNWVSTANFFNIYKKTAGPTYTLLNSLPIEATSYQAGGLTPGIACTFVVRAANGLGQESPDSNEASATPTLNISASRFTNPTWTVRINSVLQTNAILETVTIAYGSTFSTAVFSLPVDPRSGNPGLDSSVDIHVNGRLIFKGKIKTRSDLIDTGGGLRISYTCLSNIIDLTTTTICDTSVDMTSTIFNVFQKLPSGKASILNEKNANQILAPLGLLNVPATYPGQIDISDLTPLATMELVLQKLGNYKVYHQMSTGSNYAYRFGSGGFQTRTFNFGDAVNGGNILRYNIQNSNQDIVKHVKVIGAPVQKKIKKTLTNLDVGIDPDGKKRLIGTLSGKNIRDIQVYGWSREKPIVTFNEKVQVLLEDIDEGQGLKSSSIDNSFSLSDDQTGDENTASEEKSLRPIVTGMSRYSSTRQTIGARIFYKDKDSVTISVNTIPKQWYAITRSGNVDKVKVGLEGEGTISVTVLLSYGYFKGTMEVEYTVDDDKPQVTAGSGTPSKSITDNQFQIINDSIEGFNNTDDITSRMTARANNELARLQKAVMSGTITVIGDETLDLRSSVRINNLKLEISGITHNFGNGYTTTVELTNEPFFSNAIIPPSLRTQGSQPREKEKSRRTFYNSYAGKELSEADNSKHLAAQKEGLDRDTTERGPYAIYQD